MLFKGHSTISGVGSFFPDQVVKSIDIMESLKTEARFGIPHDWIDTKVGVIERRYAEDHVKPSELALEAAHRALDDAGIEAKDLDAIIYCGIVGDQIEPSTAHNIQHGLGAVNAICRDMHNACHGFSDGVQDADMMVGIGAAEHVLVVASELSRVARHVLESLNSTKSIEEFMNLIGMVSVGDGSGAMIISRKSEIGSGIQQFNYFSDGQYADLCTYNFLNGKYECKMIMDRISSIMVRSCCKMVETTLEALNWSKDSVSYVIMHQAGKRPFDAILSISGISATKAPMTLDKYGNITAATIPVNFDLLKKNGQLQQGDRCFFVGIGGGTIISQMGFIV